MEDKQVPGVYSRYIYPKKPYILDSYITYTQDKIMFLLEEKNKPEEQKTGTWFHDVRAQKANVEGLCSPLFYCCFPAHASDF